MTEPVTDQRGDFVPITEAVRRLRADLGDSVDYSISRVMSRDLRVALAWIERNVDYLDQIRGEG